MELGAEAKRRNGEGSSELMAAEADAMPLQPRRKILMVSAIAFLGAVTGGITLAQFAQGEGFVFYQQQPSRSQQTATSQSPEWSYPVDAQTQPANYAPLITVPAYQAPALPRDAYAAVYPASETPVFTDGEPGAYADEPAQPVVPVASGSWAEPDRSSITDEESPPQERQADADATGDTAKLPDQAAPES